MNTSGQSISVQKIAELAGTSPATVSRIINQNGRYSKETEQRVRKIMKEYHFRPNRLARSLRMQRSQIIGILVPDITNAFFSGIIRELQNQLFAQGYLTLICNTNESDVEEQRQVHMLLGQQVDGIIYIGGSGGAEKIDIPVVYIDRDPYISKDEREHDYVMIESDNEEGGYLAGKLLLAKGVRHPALVCFGKTLSTIRGRTKGFCRALSEKGLCLDEELFLEQKADTLSEGEAAICTLLHEHPEADGVFFTSDMLAIGALAYLTKNNIPVPDRLPVIGFDGIAMGNVATPSLTTIRQDVQQIGALAAKHICALVNQEEIDEKTIRVPVSVLSRGTC